MHIPNLQCITNNTEKHVCQIDVKDVVWNRFHVLNLLIKWAKQNTYKYMVLIERFNTRHLFHTIFLIGIANPSCKAFILLPVISLSLSENVAPSTNQTEHDHYELINWTQYGAVPSNASVNSLSLPADIIVVLRTLTPNCTNVRKVERNKVHFLKLNFSLNLGDKTTWVNSSIYYMRHLNGNSEIEQIANVDSKTIFVMVKSNQTKILPNILQK